MIHWWPTTIKVRKSKTRAKYGKGRKWSHGAFVAGVATYFFRNAFVLGASIRELADDLTIPIGWVEDAIRFEMYPRRVRLAAVRKRIR